MNHDDCLIVKGEVSYQQYLQRTGEQASAAEKNTVSWHEAQYKTSCFLKLYAATFITVSDGLRRHKTLLELGEVLNRGENVFKEYEDGSHADNHLKSVLEFREKINDDPDWLNRQPITLRDITANEKANSPYLKDFTLILEDGLHRSAAIASLILADKFTLTEIPVMYAKARPELL